MTINTKDSLQQAERDFKYVLSMSKNHVFSYLGLAKIMILRNDASKAMEYIAYAKNSSKEDIDFDWNYYINIFQPELEEIAGDFFHNKKHVRHHPNKRTPSRQSRGELT